MTSHYWDFGVSWETLYDVDLVKILPLIPVLEVLCVLLVAPPWWSCCTGDDDGDFSSILVFTVIM